MEEVINTENNPDNSDNDINNKIDTNKSELELPEKIEKDSVSNNDTKEKVKKKNLRSKQKLNLNRIPNIKNHQQLLLLL